MPLLLWDASGLAQRYAPEVGRDAVNAIFVITPRASMVTTILCYAETYAALVKKQNRGELDTKTFIASLSALQNEVIDSPDFGVLEVTFSDVLAGLDLVKRHNINSSDAANLTAFLRFAQANSSDTTCVLIAADHRLIRAAKAEGLPTLNPETVAAADVASLLAGL